MGEEHCTVEQKCLMAVLAHPDDEVFNTGGIFRRYHDAGVRTALVCATRGEAGEISDPALATPATLGQVREEELRESCRILGIKDLSFLDYRDGTVAQADEVEAVGRIVREIRRVRPQVLVTFDPGGVYGHPDHIAVHHLTTSAFFKAGDPTCYPEQLAGGLPLFTPQKLYYAAPMASAFRRMREIAASLGLPFTPGGNAATLTVDQMGFPDEAITTVVEFDDQDFELKMAAMRAHRTQTRPDSYLNRLPLEAVREWRRTERFVLAYPPRDDTVSDTMETDLFSGVRLQENE
jgi:LmbE family N-acetylglucosaminyl deacetylase